MTHVRRSGPTSPRSERSVGMAKPWGEPPGVECTGSTERESKRDPGSPGHRLDGDSAAHSPRPTMGPMTEAPSTRSPRERRDLRPDRRDRRVRHAQGGCEGQGAQGRGPAGDRLRRGRAGLRDPGVRRRGRGRGLPRPEEPPLHPRRRAARAQAGDRRRRPGATAGCEVQPGQVVVTNGGKQAIYEAFATMLDPGDEVIVPAPYWTTYPEAIQLAGGVPVPGARRRDAGVQGHRRPARGRAHRPHQGAAVRLAVQPHRRGLHRRRDPRDRRDGSRSTACGCSPTRSTSTSSTTASRPARCRCCAPRSPTTPWSSTASPRPTR